MKSLSALALYDKWAKITWIFFFLFAFSQVSFIFFLLLDMFVARLLLIPIAFFYGSMLISASKKNRYHYQWISEKIQGVKWSIDDRNRSF